MDQISILLAEDQTCVRQALRRVLESEADLQVVGEAGDGIEAIALAKALSPQVVLMDISMPRLDGINATLEIKRLNPLIGVLFLSVHESEVYFFEALRAGASGYIPKSADCDDLVEGIRTVAEGGTYIHPCVARWLVQEFVRKNGTQVQDGDRLSPRERQVLELVAEGLNNQQVSRRLCLSVNTIRHHRASLMSKLGLHDRTELVRYAISKGLISVR